MAYKVADRVKETTVVTGTGPATLLGAVSGYRTFASQLSIGDTCAYAIVNANASEWEVGIGTYSAVNTLTRTTVHASTNSNAAVVFTAGTKDVFLSPTAETVLSDVTSTDGTVTLTKTGSIVDLSVAVAAATTNVIVQVRNNTGATLTKGTVVYINNAIGQIPTVAKALATSDATSAQTLGMVSADINDNANGYVTIIGLINDINTGSYLDGDQLYLSGTTAGTFTKVKPYAPTHLVYVGVVEYAHSVHGKIFVKVQNGYEMDELHNVDAYNPSNGDLLIYNTSTNLWTHSPQSSLTVAPSQVTGTAVITSDSRLSDSRTPTGSAGGDLSGTYPNPTVQGDYFVAGSQTFSPLNYTPLLWIDSSDLATVYQDSALSVLATTDGQIVAGWKDKSGNLRHLTQSSGSNTCIYRTGVNGLNGLPGIQFNGSTSYFNFSLFASSANYTVFHVFKIPLGSYGSCAVSNSISTSRYTCGVLNTNLVSQSAHYISRYTGSDGYWSAGSNALQSTQLYTGRLTSNASATIRQNRRVLLPLTTSGNVNYTNTTYSVFGKQFDFSGAQTSGEFIYYQSSLTDSQIEIIEAYLCSKWGIK